MGFMQQTLLMFRHPKSNTWLYNGLSKTQHVIAALAEVHPQGRTRNMIWDEIYTVSGLRSHTELKQIMQQLQRDKRVKTRPDPRQLGEVANQDRRYFYYLLPHPKNIFNIPIPKKFMQKIIPRQRSDLAHTYNAEFRTRRPTSFPGRWDHETLQQIGERR